MKKRRKAAKETPVHACVRCSRPLYEQHPKGQDKEKEAISVSILSLNLDGLVCMHCVVYFLMPWLAKHRRAAFQDVFERMDEEDQDWVARALDL